MIKSEIIELNGFDSMFNRLGNDKEPQKTNQIIQTQTEKINESIKKNKRQNRKNNKKDKIS